ncbi:uncharacterized protein PV06_00978 [Exophiala oligosperma]|uniref:Amidohydrolase-related domain-containing protein n=1 Tax=Exophiala oligosperma TaxID=215243 RepID=A0A0D2EKF8_9EURO|nr:uncharacterized protein PV06_00978 [Exophiala oligosperma]KIW48384.1 hypothetical protein PV06_00978 [Exophiala oligosperma]
MGLGNMTSYAYTPSDVYWGQLAGCLEAINCGTTLVLDHSHVVYTPEHANAAISATTDSGIRSIFAYSVPMRMTLWNQTECVPTDDLLPDWAMSQLGDLIEQHNGKRNENATVEIGLGFDLWFLPKDMVLGLLNDLGSKGLRIVTTHVGRNALQGRKKKAKHTKNIGYVMKTDTVPKGFQSMIQLFSSYDLLRPPFPPSEMYTETGDAKQPFLLLSHCNGVEEKDLSLVASTGTPISSTPDTEAQMGMGWPVGLHGILRDRNQNRAQTQQQPTNTSLGVDCHSNNPSSIVLQARSLLQLARLENNNRITPRDGGQLNFPRANVLGSSEEAYNLMTIRGARCLGLESVVGSISPGKKADMVVFDAANSVGMLAAAEHDPVTAIVRFSEAADIDAVIVNGVFRKRHGKIVDIEVSGTLGDERHKTTTMPWSAIAGEVRKSRKDIQSRIDGFSVERGRDVLMNMFHVDESKLVDAT